jgi:hypothetical protein
MDVCMRSLAGDEKCAFARRKGASKRTGERRKVLAFFGTCDNEKVGRMLFWGDRLPPRIGHGMHDGE